MRSLLLLETLNQLLKVGCEGAVAGLLRQFQSGLQVGEVLLELTKFTFAIAPSCVGVSVVRLQLEGLVRVADRPLASAKMELDNAPIEVSVGAIPPS